LSINLDTLKLMELSPDNMILVDVKGVADQTRALANSACCTSSAGVPAAVGAVVFASFPAEELAAAGFPAGPDNNFIVEASSGAG
jgi:hypothetical protein